MKKKLSLLLVCLLVCMMVFGCGKSGGVAMENADAVLKDESYPEGDVVDSTAKEPAAPQPNQKLIRRIWLQAETENMDTLLTGVNQRVAELGGYIESKDVYNGSQYSGNRYRNAELTIRIPADQLDAFVQHMEGSSNITSNKETTEDITLTYVATQSRITALETEEQRLLELLAEAKNMSDLLQIESRLTEVREELEKVKSQLRVYENQVSYGTVYLSVNEVKEYTVTEEPDTVWERISTGFVRSLKDLGTFFVDLFVFLVVASPYLLLLAIPVVILILAIRRYNKKYLKKEKTKDKEK